MNTSSVARQFATSALAAVIVDLVPNVSAGQVLVASFDRIGTRVSAGDEVRVSDASGQNVRGRVVGVEPHALVLWAGGRRVELLEADVTRVEKYYNDSGWDGAAYGAACGVGGLLGVAYVGDREFATDPEVLPGLVVAGAAGGALVGLIVDKVHRRQRTVYVGAPAGRTPLTLSVAPIVAAHSKGVALSFTF
jgi:hypothetical protein